jgi:hypothetical protein
MRNSSLRILEIIWFTTGALCATAAIRSAIIEDGNKTFLFALMAIISSVFGWLRHKQRKKS